MSKSIGTYCPHCGTRMRVNARKQPSKVLHKLVVQCPNERCMASFNAHVEVISSIQPSLSPNPEISHNIRQLHPWFIELEHLVKSIEITQSTSPAQISHAKGFISGLYFTGMLSLTEAQHYNYRIDQINLFQSETL